jgi:hypothetical protein
MVSGEVVLAAIALVLSFPPVAMAVVFVTHPNLRVAFWNRDGAQRRAVIAYLVIETSAAVVLWGIFLLAVVRR